MSIPSESVINNLYNLFDEVTKGLSDEQILEEIRRNPDPEFDKQINTLKVMKAKAIAKSKQSLVDRAKVKLKRYMADTDLFDSLSNTNQQNLSILYRKFKNTSAKDQKALRLDEQLLDFMSELESDDN